MSNLHIQRMQGNTSDAGTWKRLTNGNLMKFIKRKCKTCLMVQTGFLAEQSSAAEQTEAEWSGKALQSMSQGLKDTTLIVSQQCLCTARKYSLYPGVHKAGCSKQIGGDAMPCPAVQDLCDALGVCLLSLGRNKVREEGLLIIGTLHSS